ncbi:uncharacterized protein RAG0_09036 [Rhynchosporium agropyri]|uniref:Thioredoxin-like protein AAED1 n=1 Tax=Rhynchosporium agropyri TaxID=914238 RepID=A0A1E1KTH6_9HELO|nr:uncharacterized protein RAG0_09036 [Rhynchosporium agropyri]
MAISTSNLFSSKSAPLSNSKSTSTNPSTTPSIDAKNTASMTSLDQASETTLSSHDAAAEFDGEVNTNDTLPTQETLKKVENHPILDQDGRSIPFKNLYTGPNVARRVLVIFVRHFYCGNCQEYVRTLTSSITPSSLLSLPTPTFIAIVGCGSPSLIPMWIDATSCPFPVYADPTKLLYSELGMFRTLNMGNRPEYQRKDFLSLMIGGFWQSMSMVTSGQALKGGDMYQVGGEFMFEPVNDASPICTPGSVGEEEKRLSAEAGKENGADGERGEEGMLELQPVEEKRVTWCHRMRNTRDHAEMPEVREVLGLDGEGVMGNCKKRWSKAMETRKGTGLSRRNTGTADGDANEAFRRKIKELDEGSSKRASSEDKENVAGR